MSKYSNFDLRDQAIYPATIAISDDIKNNELK